jgi:hypothetical protein
VSFLENDVDCAQKHRGEIEAVAKGKLYAGENLELPSHLHDQYCEIRVLRDQDYMHLFVHALAQSPLLDDQGAFYT